MQDNQQEQIEQYLNQRKKQEEPSQQSEAQQKRKISFIKQHIVDHYKGDQEIQELFAQFFMSYLQEKKGIDTQQHNLGLLSFNQLEDIVKNFQKTNPFQVIEERRKSIILAPAKEEENEENFKQNEALEKTWNAKKVYYSNGAWDYQLNGYQQCSKQKAFFLQRNRQAKYVEIFFSKHEVKKSGGFFGIGSSLELWISMKSSIIKGLVERTAQDFIFLRQALKVSAPHNFLPPLEINEVMLKKVDTPQIKAAILKECHRFINSLCNIQELLENFYTFRFFTQIKYENYISHKKTIRQVCINHIKLVKNKQGCVEIQISDRNQLLKKDYGRKSEYLQKMWRFVGESNSKITQKLSEIQSQIVSQKKQFQSILKDISTSNQLLQSSSYEKLSEALLCYNDIYKVYEQNITSIQQFFIDVSKKLSIQAQKNWKAFMNYKTEVFQYSNEYQAKRKAFLQKGQSNLKQPSKIASTAKGDQKVSKQKNPKMSIISELGIDETSEREFAWIERFSKWQGYINRKFIKSFEDLVESDRQTLKEILQKTAQKTLQLRGKEQISFLQHLTMINV